MWGRGSDPATRQRQLKEEAYMLVIKSMVIRGKPDSALLGKLRMELGIDLEFHKKGLTELVEAKRNNTLQPHDPHTSALAMSRHTPSPAPSGRLPNTGGAAPAARPAPRPQQQQQQQQPLPSQPPPPQQQPAASKPSARVEGDGIKRQKMKSLSGGEGVAGPGPATRGLVTEHIGRKVRRFWPQEQRWYDGVFTDYKDSDGQYCVTYHLGSKNESFEWLDIYAPDLATNLEIMNGKVDLRSYPNSRAVNNSTVLKVRKLLGGGGGAAGQKQGGPPAGGGLSASRAKRPAVKPGSRKRNASVLRSDSEDDEVEEPADDDDEY